MIEKLLHHIHSYIETPLSEHDKNLISEVFQLKKIRKHQFLIQSGDVCKTAGFVVKGALKKYTLDETGKENILDLYIENWWVGDRESFMTGAPTPFYIDACEDCEILTVSKEDFIHKLRTTAFFTEFGRVMTERQSYQLIKRLQTAKTYTAEQKLAALQNTYPEFLQRFPQHIIASYLGMTKETLSRIRSHTSKNKD